MQEKIKIRSLQTAEEYRACQELQMKVWGLPELEVLPYHQALTAVLNGGMLLGAYDGEKLVGFCYGFVGLDEAGDTIICSHMLAVLPDYRGQGIGYQLKLAQREKALSRGIKTMTWTYDPMEAANAYLNIHRLGGVVRHYYVNHYGEMPDKLNQGIPSDRLLLEWYLDSKRVRAILEKRFPPISGEARKVLFLQHSPHGPEPGGIDLEAAENNLLVEIPSNFQVLKKEAFPLALRWRLEVRKAMLHYLSRGYRVEDVLRRDREKIAYVLVKGEE
ncbi:MAG: GNAT family N-acetyltransferase [Clostridia bacterium]|nr:GNAT family N-acetyltransferase [Clostridia bacterium]